MMILIVCLYDVDKVNGQLSRTQHSSSPTCLDSSVIYLSTTMATKQTNLKKNEIPHLEAVDRILHLPVVVFGYNYAENVYTRIKESNNVIHWAFGTAESSIHFFVSTTLPTATATAAVFEKPISLIDKLLCQSLDVVEHKVPQITLPPEELYSNGREYVNDNFVRPILQRADSVKQIGINSIDNKYTAITADTIEGALNVADKYVDKYLPAEAAESESNANDNQAANTPIEKAVRTIHHADVLSRKLKRRLTRRTLSEAKALKEGSVEAVNLFKYVVELIVKDPKLALQKSQELWLELSKNEPENQTPPENLEQLIVLLSRESSRRVVHLINYTNALITGIPDDVKGIASKLVGLLEGALKATHIDGLSNNVIELAKGRVDELSTLLHLLNTYASTVLGLAAKSSEKHQQGTSAPSKSASTSNQVNATSKGSIVTNGVDNSK